MSLRYLPEHAESALYSSVPENCATFWCMSTCPTPNYSCKLCCPPEMLRKCFFARSQLLRLKLRRLICMAIPDLRRPGIAGVSVVGLYQHAVAHDESVGSDIFRRAEATYVRLAARLIVLKHLIASLRGAGRSCSAAGLRRRMLF